jgi:hypothetical protein
MYIKGIFMLCVHIPDQELCINEINNFKQLSIFIRICRY